MPTTQEIFGTLKERDNSLASKVSAKGLSEIADDALQLSRDCASNYDTLWQAELFGQAEQLRDLAHFWAMKYEDTTGIEEVPKIPRYRSIA
jgi:hypothetical protein